MAITTPDAVPGELIQASWGDAVRADLTALDTGKANDSAVVHKSGDTMSGSLIVGGDPTGAVGAKLGTLGALTSRRDDTFANIILERAGSSGATVAGQQFIVFQRLGVAIGSVTIAGSLTGVVYNTTSDPRLKHVDGPADDAATLAATLGAAAFRGRWINPDSGEPDGDPWVMLSSHDVEAVAPYAVTGSRDAVDETGAPVYQKVDYSALVPLLFAALADALDRIAALEGAAP